MIPKQIRRARGGYAGPRPRAGGHHGLRAAAGYHPVPAAAAEPGALASDGVLKLQRQIGNQAVIGLLRPPATGPAPARPSVRQRPAPLQRMIRPGKDTAPYPTADAVVKAHPASGTPAEEQLALLKRLVESTTIDIDASGYSSWEELITSNAHRLDEPEATPSAPVTRADVELLVDENFLPVAIQEQFRDALVWKRKGWTGGWATGQIFYTPDATDDSPLLPLPPEMINAYWDAKYPSPFTRVSGPDWRKNCADHAIGESFPDVAEAKAALASSWPDKHPYSGPESLVAIMQDLAPGEYVAQVGTGWPHFIRLTVGGGTVAMSQKDGESGVYEATMSRGDAAGYIVGKSGSGIIYRRP
jgi:hypothetical protein